MHGDELLWRSRGGAIEVYLNEDALLIKLIIRHSSSPHSSLFTRGVRLLSRRAVAMNHLPSFLTLFEHHRVLGDVAVGCSFERPAMPVW